MWERTYADRAHGLVSQVEQELLRRYGPPETPNTRQVARAELEKLPEVEFMLDTAGGMRRALAREVIRRSDGILGRSALLSMLAGDLLILEEDDFAQILAPIQSGRTPGSTAERVVSDLVRVIRRQHDLGGSARLEPLLRGAAANHSDPSVSAVLYAVVGERDLYSLVQGGTGFPYVLLYDLGDFADRLREVFDASPESEDLRAEMLRLLTKCQGNTRPSARWRAEVEAVCARFKDPDALASALLDAANRAGLDADTHRAAGMLRGIVTLTGIVGNAHALRDLRRLAVRCLALHSPGSDIGLSITNACVGAMAEVGGMTALTEFLALERSVRHGTVLQQVRRAIVKLAAERGLARDELLELAVERHGLDSEGSRRIPLSRGHAIVTVEGWSVTLSYADAKGTRRKTFPAAVKTEDASVLAELRREVRSIRTTLAGERTRLDGLLVAGQGDARSQEVSAELRAGQTTRRWRYDNWQRWYLDHPITGRLTRSVIWRFRSTAGAPEGGTGPEVVGMPTGPGRVLTTSGQEITLGQHRPEDIEVRLWHPVGAAPDEVRAWRQFLFDRQVCQPVKQAYREIYVRTPAERHTRVYSNRFAGHIFGQVQARALLKGRGWKPVAVAWWDDGIDHGVATRVFSHWGIRAEFFFDPISELHPDSGDLYPYCASDQIRFFRTADDEPVGCDAVPSLVFSEAMRDIDLVVGVTSIGADPQWLDRGEGRHFDGYWTHYGFGELGTTARVRREVLARLLPQLAIADRCTLDGRYLMVRGDLRTYRVHLGSGNILMSPNNQYLCIVDAKDSRAENVFLPFDDDRLLSLILSKAFMLANDTAITDPTITEQLRSA
ncbi:MAG: DUF4132 domain-containing protein [Nocardioides sp.]